MSLNGLFGIIDYLIYLVQSTNRHGVHSPFVYHFTDKILYGKSPCLFEPSAEMCRKRMVQSRRKINIHGKEESLSKVAINLIPSSKYNRLFFDGFKKNSADNTSLKLAVAWESHHYMPSEAHMLFRVILCLISTRIC